MLSKSSIVMMRTEFEHGFPEYAKRLSACKTQTGLKDEYEAIYAEALAKAKPYLSSGEDFPIFGITPNMYGQLIAAEGDNIKVVLGTLVATAQLVQPTMTVGNVAAVFMASGLTALTKEGVNAFKEAIETDAKVVEAVAHAIGAIGVEGVYAVLVLIIVATIIPILYFMLKPACCFICVLNETSQALAWVDDYNVHGKPVGRCNEIPAALLHDNVYVSCGFVQTDKCEDALVGTQYGFTYRYDTSTTVSFGTECPLTSLYVDNNCYCAINSGSETAANQTDEHNALTWSTSIQSPKLTASIACNSGSGSVAYYIARVRDGSISN